MHLPTMTTRRWMVAVAALGLLMAGSLRIAAYAQYASALGRYRAVERYYDEGRVTLTRCVEESHRLMEARLPLCLTSAGQAAAIKDHLARSRVLIERELNEEPVCRDNRHIYVAEARAILDRSRSRLRRMVGTGGTLGPE